MLERLSIENHPPAVGAPTETVGVRRHRVIECGQQVGIVAAPVGDLSTSGVGAIGRRQVKRLPGKINRPVGADDLQRNQLRAAHTVAYIRAGQQAIKRCVVSHGLRGNGVGVPHRRIGGGIHSTIRINAHGARVSGGPNALVVKPALHGDAVLGSG